MDPMLPIYGAIANATINLAEADLGEGLRLRRCNGHIGSYSIVAFSAPPGPGLPHPAPWVTVQDGHAAFDLALEIFIPAGVVVAQPLNRLNLVWFIPHLLRLRQKIPLFLPAVSNFTFAVAPADGHGNEIIRGERLHRLWWAENVEGPLLNDQTIAWVRQYWRPSLQLWNRPAFRNLIEAFDVLALVATPSLGLVLLFGALEYVFLAGMKAELTFRLSAYIAAYLEPPGEARIALQKTVKKLYDARSGAAHGANNDALEALRETEHLFRRILIKIIEEGTIPTPATLEHDLFGSQNQPPQADQ